MSTPSLVTDPIRLGTRASQLARTQSATVGDALAAVSGRAWAEVLVTTPGDDTTKPLDQPGSPGLFVSTLRRALLAGEVDVVVHSFKDLPSAPEPGIALAAVPARVDPRDALVSRDHVHLADLPPGSVVGTSSPRRAAALARLRPDLVIRPIRGNVDTRLRKVRDGEFDATVLAVAGLTRIGRLDEITQVLDDMLPAPAQGALAVECREGDTTMRSLLSRLDDTQARLVTAAERHVLVGINAACTTAVGAHATYGAGLLHLRAELTVDGHHASTDVSGPCEPDDLLQARVIGLRAAAQLTGHARPVLLIRSEGNDTDAQALSDFGIAAITEPFVRIAPLRDGPDAAQLLTSLRDCADDPSAAQSTWLVATSPMTVPSWLAAVDGADLSAAVAAAAAAGVRAAATGQRTASTLRDLGFPSVRVPADSSARGLVDDLATLPPGNALFPRGNLALRTLPDGLRDLGWQVDEGVVYETTTVPDRPASASLIEGGEVSAVILRSPSAVRALVAHATVPATVPIVCAGRTTADAARAAGLTVATTAASPSSGDVAAAVALVLGAEHPAAPGTGG